MNTFSKFNMYIIQNFFTIHILNTSKYLPLTFCYQGHMNYQIIFQRSLGHNETLFISIIVNKKNIYLNSSWAWWTFIVRGVFPYCVNKMKEKKLINLNMYFEEFIIIKLQVFISTV